MSSLLRKKLAKHLDLIINCESQEKINKSAEDLAKELIEDGSKESYESLLTQLGYHEIKVKKIEKRKK